VINLMIIGVANWLPTVINYDYVVHFITRRNDLGYKARRLACQSLHANSYSEARVWL